VPWRALTVSRPHSLTNSGIAETRGVNTSRVVPGSKPLFHDSEHSRAVFSRIVKWFQDPHASVDGDTIPHAEVEDHVGGRNVGQARLSIEDVETTIDQSRTSKRMPLELTAHSKTISSIGGRLPRVVDSDCHRSSERFLRWLVMCRHPGLP